jgi:hypothetical protein
MLTGEGTYATVLLVWAIDRLGYDEETGQPNVFVWSPETVMEEIHDETGVKLPRRNFSKLMAAVTVVTTDLFFRDVGRFIQLANVLAGDEFSPEEFNPADSVECAWAVTEGLLLWPPDEEDQEPFSDDVRHYIGHVLREEGYVTPPDVLKIALDSDFTGRVATEFSDDPEMFQAITENQNAKAAEVAAVIVEGLSEMLSQMRALTLRDGTTDEVEKKIMQVLRLNAAQAQEG